MISVEEAKEKKKFFLFFIYIHLFLWSTW